MRSLITILLPLCLIGADNCMASSYSKPSISLNYAQNIHDGYATNQLFVLGWEFEYESAFFEFKFDGHYTHDFVYSHTDRYSPVAEDRYQDRLTVDEAYIAFDALDSYWRIGVQKVVWGEADDLQVVDVVNPLDFRDSVLFDIDEYRIGLPMLKVDYEVADDVNLSFTTVFQYQSNKYPPRGSEFTTNGFEDVDVEKFGYTEFGLRLDTLLLDSDMSFYGFYGYNDDPVIVTSIENRRKRVIDQYTMLGSSISRPFGSWLVRSELAFSLNLPVGSAKNSVTRIDKIQGLLGLDYRYIDWTATFQYANHWIKNYSADLQVPKSDPIYTLSLEREFFSGNFIVKSAISYSSSFGDGTLAQLKLAYKLTPDFHIKLNLDSLSGSERNIFGQFDDKDRLYFSTIYYF